MSNHRASARMTPGHFTATPKAARQIRWIEQQITDWFAGADVSVFDVVAAALSLSGLDLTAGTNDNKAVVQSVEPW